MERTKEVLTFLNPEDEADLWNRMRVEIPSLALVDGSRWPTPMPPLADSPAACTNLIVFLWSREVQPHLPSRERGDMHDGPSSGVVVEWSRCRTIDGELRSGRFAVGYDPSNVAMKKFVDQIFRCVKGTTGNRLVRLSGEPDRTYRLGQHTREAALSAGLRLRDRSVEIYYEVDSSA